MKYVEFIHHIVCSKLPILPNFFPFIVLGHGIIDSWFMRVIKLHFLIQSDFIRPK